MESAPASYLKHTVFLSASELCIITHCHDMGSYSIPNNLAGLESLAFPHSQVIAMLLGECAMSSKSHLLPPSSLSPVAIRDAFLLCSCLIKPFCCGGVGGHH